MEVVSEAIRLGRYAPGEKLPGMKEMSRELGMNFLTVRRAMMELADKGIVNIRHGAGTFVQESTGSKQRKCIKIGLAIRSFMLHIDRNHPTVGAFLAGAHKRCQGYEYRVQALVFDEGRFTEQLRRTILEESFDGIIVTAAGMTTTDYGFLQQQNISLQALDLPEFDLTDRNQLSEAIAGKGIVINCAAYTNVEKAES